MSSSQRRQKLRLGHMERWVLPVLMLLLAGCLHSQRERMRPGEVSPQMRQLLETEVNTFELANVKPMEIMLDHVERLRRLLEREIADDQRRIAILIDSELAQSSFMSHGPFPDGDRIFVFGVPVIMRVRDILDTRFCYEGISEWVVESDTIIIRRIPGTARTDYSISTNNPLLRITETADGGGPPENTK